MYHREGREHFPSERKKHMVKLGDRREHDAFQDLKGSQHAGVQGSKGEAEPVLLFCPRRSQTFRGLVSCGRFGWAGWCLFVCISNTMAEKELNE